MNLETLEDDLRSDQFSEKEIAQILAFIFALNSVLPPKLDYTRNYFIKFISSKASSFLEKIFPEPLDHKGTYEAMVDNISKDVLNKFASKELNREQALAHALESIKKEVGGIRNKIINIGTTTLNMVLINLKIEQTLADEISKQFKSQILLELK